MVFEPQTAAGMFFQFLFYKSLPILLMVTSRIEVSMFDFECAGYSRMVIFLKGQVLSYITNFLIVYAEDLG